MKNEQAQRRIIAAAFFPTKSYTIVPSSYEQLLADKYIEGALTIHQSVELLEEYHRNTMSAKNTDKPASWFPHQSPQYVQELVGK